MRAPVLLALVAIGSPAHADGFGEVALGLAIPVANDNWTNLVEPSPKVAVRGGAMSGDFGGMLGLDWIPQSLDNGGGSFGIGSTNSSVQRFRAIASAVFHHRVAPKVTLSGRAGVGIDLVHGSFDVTILGSTSTTSDTDVGYAFEFGAGVWFDLAGKQVGFELAIPIGHHNKHAQNSNELTADWTSVDVDLLVGLRF